MIKFKETIYYETEQITKSHENGSRQYQCPKCTGYISWNRIPCPEGIGAVCVTTHMGYICDRCRTQFDKVKESEL